MVVFPIGSGAESGSELNPLDLDLPQQNYLIRTSTTQPGLLFATAQPTRAASASTNQQAFPRTCGSTTKFLATPTGKSTHGTAGVRTSVQSQPIENTLFWRIPLMQFEGLEKNEHQDYRSSVEIATSAVEFSILPEAILCSGPSGTSSCVYAHDL